VEAGEERMGVQTRREGMSRYNLDDGVGIGLNWEGERIIR
jgi:hypothetical protein